MKGLLLLTPILGCVFALIAYLLGGGLWTILGAFFVAGPLAIVLLGLLLGGRSDETSDQMRDGKRRH